MRTTTGCHAHNHRHYTHKAQALRCPLRLSKLKQQTNAPQDTWQQAVHKPLAARKQLC
jgi:hypothetical protein